MSAICLRMLRCRGEFWAGSLLHRSVGPDDSTTQSILRLEYKLTANTLLPVIWSARVVGNSKYDDPVGLGTINDSKWKFFDEDAPRTL
jgi:hypothetical protein